MADITIRAYLASDFERLKQIHDPARKEELALANLSDAFLPLEVSAEREGLFDYSVYVAELEGVVVGFVAFSEDELAWLYVDVNAMRRGIGTRLASFALERIGADASIEVLAGNAPAIALYSSLGFSIKETLHGKMPGNEAFPVTVHVMTKA